MKTQPTISFFQEESFLGGDPVAKAFVELFNALPTTVLFVKDRKSQFVGCNQLMLESKGLASGTGLFGKRDADFHPPVLAAAYQAEDEKVMSTLQPVLNVPWFVMDPKGLPQWFHSSKVPVLGEEGIAVGLIGARYPIDTDTEVDAAFQGIAPALRLLQINYNQTVTTEELAKVSGFSVTHLNRTFRKLLGLSPQQFIQALRIEKSRQLLKTTRLPIGEIALDCGYYDQSHFTRHFRAANGIAPLAYRKTFGKVT